MQVNAGGKQPRRISAAEAAALVRSGDWVDYGISLLQPDVFDQALGARLAELRQVKIRSCLAVRPRAVLEADPTGEHVLWLSWFFTGYERKKHDGGISHYIPMNLGEIAEAYRRFAAPVDIVVIKARPMDAEGYFNFGGTSLWHQAVIDCAKTVIIEECAALPHACGMPSGVHCSQVDFIIDGDGQPPAESPSAPSTEVDRAVGRLIVGEIEDGACLQIGIGGMPNAVCALLLESDVRDLSIHTEMLTEGMGALYRAGRITGRGKALHPDKIVYSFTLGSRELYATFDRNPDFLCLPVEETNPPHIIMRNDRVVAINNTTQLDLYGQAASESDGHRHISGTGGQLQFVRGAYASKGGKSFICLSSVYERHGVRKSRIVLNLTPGNIVTTPRSDMMYVATEYGIANLKGLSVPERAKAIIQLAHPEFREGLARAARDHGLVPRGFW